MNKNYISIAADALASDVVNIFEDRDLVSAPVVDKNNILLLVLVVLFIVFIGSFLRQPKIYTFYKEQFVPSDMDTVFEFFSRPENLEKITPTSMGFNIITPSPIEMKEGAIIDYTVKIMGVPMRWRTMITSYKKNEYFVDEQLKGPYSYWHHRHSFKEVEGGVLIIDEITYALPIQALSLIHISEPTRPY